MEAKLKKGADVVKSRIGGDLSISDAATIYGCCGIFDLCGDSDLMSLSFAKTEPFLDWLGWEPTKVCEIKKNFITWERPAYAQGSPTSDIVADPCADGNGVEWGECDFTLDHFGRLRRRSPTRDVTRITLRLCDNQPRYRLDGQQIRDDDEYDMRIVTEVLLQALKRLVITGNHATPGSFDGLNVLVNNAYVNSRGRRCSIMDSIVVDMNGNGMAGGAGSTWNGAPIGAGYNFIQILLAVYQRIRARIRMAGALSGNLAVGDMILAAPSTLIQCILNTFACWSTCGMVDAIPAGDVQQVMAYRNSLNGGMFGAGRIFLDGFEIPLIAYDWGLIQSPTLFDAFLLTNKVGGVRLINGQYNDMRDLGNAVSGYYQATDGGRLLTYVGELDNTCYNRTVEMQPRMLMWAPWAQARFHDVQCNQPGGVLSPDPLSSFFPETSFSVADCPDDSVVRFAL